MNRVERLQAVIEGERVEQVPVTLWRHWAGDDQRAADFARAVIEFQWMYQWDLSVVAPSRLFQVSDYGVNSSWTGSSDGLRTLTKPLIQRSLDWTELRVLDAERGELGKQLQALKIIDDHFTPETIPFIVTIYSPLTQAAMLAGHDLLLRHLRRRSDRLQTGLNNITDSTLRFLTALRQYTNVAGILFITDMADDSVLSEEEYIQFGLPYTQKILNNLPDNWWLNGIQVNGSSPMLHLFAQLPVQMLTWSDQDAKPSLDKSLAEFGFNGSLCGGLSANQHLLHGTPTTIREAVRQALYATNRRRFILSAGRAISPLTPTSNLHATRDAVQ